MNLPDDVRVLLDDGQLSAGHARALLAAEDPARLAREVVTRKLNVRDTERLVQREKAGLSGPSGSPAGSKQKDADTRILEQDLSERTGLVVAISHNANSGAGSVTLRYQDLDQLDLIVERLSAHPKHHVEPYLPPDADEEPMDAGAIARRAFDGYAEVDDDEFGADEFGADGGKATRVLPASLDLDDDEDEEPVATDPSARDNPMGHMEDDDPRRDFVTPSGDKGGSADPDEPADAADIEDPADTEWDFEDDDEDDPLVPKS